MSQKVKLLVDKYNLQPHIEGGYFLDDYKSRERLPKEVTGTGQRHAMTSCYYLLEEAQHSLFHRLKFDETWFFLDGGPCALYQLSPDEGLVKRILHSSVENGSDYKIIIPSGTWFAAKPEPGSVFSFCSCLVAPGFDFDDWERGDPDELAKMYPQEEELIRSLT